MSNLSKLRARIRRRIGALTKRQWIAFAIAGLVVICLGALFHPDVQKRLVLKFAAPHVEHLSLDRIHVLPWAATLERVDVRYLGGTFAADTVALRFCLSSLVTRTINIKELVVDGGRVDLRTFAPPPAPPAGPFAGVFPNLDFGFGVALKQAAIDLSATLSDTDRAQFSLRGGDIDNEQSGTLSFVGRFESGADTRINVEGSLALDQLKHGQYNELLLNSLVTVELPTLPESERFKVAATLKPTAHPPTREVTTSEGESSFEPLPETIRLVVVQQDRDGGTRASFETDALYNGLDGVIGGTYTLASNEKIATRYLAGVALPRFIQSATGSYDANITSLAGTLQITSKTDITDLQSVLGRGPKVPGLFSLLQDVSLSFTQNEIVVKTMKTRITDEQAQTIIGSSMPQAIAIDPTNPMGFLSQPHTLLTVNLGGILLAWFDALLPDYDIASGAIKADLKVTTDESGTIDISPEGKFAIEDIRIDNADGPIIESVNISMTPNVRSNATQTTVDIPDLKVTIGESTLATARLSLKAPVDENGAAPKSLKIEGSIHLDPVLEQPAVRRLLAETPLPDGLSIHFDSAIATEGTVIRVQTLNARIAQKERDNLLTIKSKQPFRIETDDTGRTLKNPAGDLAVIDVNDIDLSWINPFSAPYAIAGRLERASFTLQAADAANLTATAADALRITGLNVSDGDQRILQNVFMSVRPTLNYTPALTRIDYESLRIAGGRKQMLNGSGSVSIGDTESVGLAIDAEGRAEIILNNLGTQPVVATALAGKKFETPISTSLTYRVSHNKASTKIQSLDLKLLHSNTPYVTLNTRSGLTVKPALEAGENLAQYAVGEMTLSIDAVTPAVLEDFVPLQSINFDSINGVLSLRSDGNRLFASSERPLRVDNIRLSDADGLPLLHAFDFVTSANVTAAGDAVDTNVDDLNVTFRGHNGAALSGRFAATIEPGRTIPLRELQAEFSGDLPQLLNQPVVLPGHSLSSGTLASKLAVDRGGNITANTTIGELASTQALAIHTIEMPLTGNMRADGKGFDFSMPLTGTGNSGSSDALTLGDYLPSPGKPSLLHLHVTSDLFYLNDILATVAGIGASKSETSATEATNGNAQKTPVVIDDSADKAAFWNALPYDTRVNFAFKQMFYSDYVAFHDIKGEVDLTDNTLTIGDFAAYFHESPITFDGGLSFDADKPDPYTADIVGKVEDFDLNQFFTEFAPTKKSRIEGLFGVDIAIGGESPNAAQFRNRLLLDLAMQSRAGLYRTLPPDSALMIGASDALGVVGESLSYLPTGGFGAGAVSRLVNYIAEIEYDAVDIRITRDTSLDLEIERFEVLSPAIRLTATGTIQHVPGKDIVDSPLDAVANLNMVGKGAAILYSIGLLEDEQDEFGYEQGPEFRISGSLQATESNLAEIIQRAGDGSVKGGVTRPVAGLIGNIKYRWFGDDAKLDAAKASLTGPEPAANPVE